MFTVEEYWCSALHNYQNLTLKEQNIGPDLHHYKHNVSLTLFAKQYTQVIYKTLNTLECFRHRSISRCNFLAIPKHCKSNYHTLWQLVKHSHQVRKHMIA